MRKTSSAGGRMQSYAYSYAKAIFDLAKVEGSIDRVEDDLKLIVNTVKSHLNLKAVFSDSKIDEGKRKQVAREIFKDKVSPIALYLLELVIDLKREQLLPDVSRDFSKLAHTARSELVVEVTTAFPLNEDQQRKLTEKLSGVVGKEVLLKTDLDESILGGVVVRVGDKVIDGSISRRLESLKQQLSSARIGGGN